MGEGRGGEKDWGWGVGEGEGLGMGSGVLDRCCSIIINACSQRLQALIFLHPRVSSSSERREGGEKVEGGQTGRLQETDGKDRVERARERDGKQRDRGVKKNTPRKILSRNKTKTDALAERHLFKFLF